jgi:hypothetical protein
MAFYDEMQDMASELIDELKQGAVTLRRETPGAPDPAEPWVPVEPTVETWPLAAAVRRLHQRYENGALIVETGDMVTFAVPAVVPDRRSGARHHEPDANSGSRDGGGVESVVCGLSSYAIRGRLIHSS